MSDYYTSGAGGGKKVKTRLIDTNAMVELKMKQHAEEEARRQEEKRRRTALEEAVGLGSEEIERYSEPEEEAEEKSGFVPGFFAESIDPETGESLGEIPVYQDVPEEDGETQEDPGDPEETEEFDESTAPLSEEGAVLASEEDEEEEPAEEAPSDIAPPPHLQEEIDAILEEAREEAERIRTEAAEEAENAAAAIREEAEKNAAAESEQILQNAREEGERLKEAARAEGKEEGLAAGREEAAAELSEEEKRLDELKQQLLDAHETAIREMEPKLLDVILQVFNRVFHIQFDDKKEILEYLVINAVMNIEGSREFRIKTSAENYPYISAHLPEIKAQVGEEYALEVVSDSAMGSNKCVIETDSGLFDCSIGVHLENLIKDLKSLAPKVESR